jgi:hypothetical protein
MTAGGDSIRFDSLGMRLRHDVALSVDSIIDIRVSSASTAIRPGFHTRVPVSLFNDGAFVMRGTVRWKYDSSLHYIRSIPAHSRHDSINQVVEWDFDSLAIGDKRNWRAIAFLDSTVSIGTMLHDSL